MFSPGTRILIIDDMPAIRDLVRNALWNLGYKNLIEASDGQEALKLLVEHNKPGHHIQLIISDWNMPKLKGLDLLKQLRNTKEWANLPFILLTSEAERDQVSEAVLAGVSQYIIKPFSSKIFEEKLRSTYKKHFKV